MPQTLTRIAALLSLLLLAACGPQLVQADVTRFNTLAGTSGGRSFTILPEEGQRGSLEFENYARMVAAQLEGLGWQPVPATAGATPETVVFLHWGVGQAHVETWQTPTTVYGGYGWGHRPWYGGGIYEPFPYYETRSATYIPVWFSVDILDGPAWRRGTPNKLFEGRAVASTTRAESAPVVPYLVRALFTNFPGLNGQTVRVAVPTSNGRGAQAP